MCRSGFGLGSHWVTNTVLPLCQPLTLPHSSLPCKSRTVTTTLNLPVSLPMSACYVDFKSSIDLTQIQSINPF